MIAERLAQLQRSFIRPKKDHASSHPCMDVCLAGECILKASRYQKTNLDTRKNCLAQSAEQWRERVKADPVLESLVSIRRLRKDQPSKTIRPPVVLAIDKGLDKFYTSDITQSATTCTPVEQEELDSVTANPASRLLAPVRPATCGRNRRIRTHCHLDLSTPKTAVVPVKAINYRLKCDENDNDDVDNGEGFTSSAKRGLQSKLDYSVVKLKKAEIKTPYPELMLIRIKGDKHVDVRLVAPKYTSVHAYAVFILVTPTRLYLYNGKYSNLREKSKATAILKSICDKNGELGCNAKVVQNVHEGMRVTEFWTLLGYTVGDELPNDAYVPDDLLDLCEPFEVVAARFNNIYEITSDNRLLPLIIAEKPKYSLLRPEKNLLFDFGSELYVWVGRSADRTGAEQGVAYAKELLSKGMPENVQKHMLIFGDDFICCRPEWCILIRLSQGLSDSLFRHKFPDWDTSVRFPYSPKRFKTVTCASPCSPHRDEEDARKLGRSLAALMPEEAVLNFEETELHRRSTQIFTENLRYFILEGERNLRELDDLWLFKNDCCYVVKWEYRIERNGVRKLDGTERDHETGRPRVAFFYWLGANTTKTEQGLCALALRDFDSDHFPHERVLQNQEPPIFLQLFKGKMTITGANSGVYLVYSSSVAPEARMEELNIPVIYRSHAAYMLTDYKDVIEVLYRSECSETLKNATDRLCEHFRMNHPVFKDRDEKPAVEKRLLDDLPSGQVIRADGWKQPPRLFRIYKKEGEELSWSFWDPALSFTFRQDNLRDTMLVDQGNRLWLWSDSTVSTFALRVAEIYWNGRSGPKTVICKTLEPEAFKALFPEWEDFTDEENENRCTENLLRRSDPEELEELLSLRTRKWPLEKVISRNLPLGVDLNRLEDYLYDEDFESVFHMNRVTFYSLPPWKQIELRKKNKLF